MSKISKRLKSIRESVSKIDVYKIEEAVSKLKDLTSVKFVESVDCAVILGVDPRKSDQVVRGASLLPNGTGRDVRVAVFAQGDSAAAAKAEGAEIVGFEDLAEDIKNKAKSGEDFGFDVLIASPDAMRLVGQLGRVLGPKGLMPNPKVGTVTPDVAGAVKNAKSGQVSYRTDKAGIIHCTIGKVSFEVNAIKENLEKLISDLIKAKPTSAKGLYLKKVIISTTMGPGLVVEQSSLSL